MFPLDVQVALDEHGAPEFQLVHGEDDTTLRVRVEHEGDGGAIIRVLEEQLMVPVAVEAVAPGSLPRAAFKPRRIAQ